MTTFTAIPNSDIDPDSPITTALMTLLRDNPLAIQEGDATAPDVAMAALASYPFNQADVGAASIGQGELKSTTASQSFTASTSNPTVVALTGGSYTMGWFLGATSTEKDMRLTPHSSSYAAKIAAYCEDSYGCSGGRLYSRYIQASPPWRMPNSDLDIPLFIFALVDRTTKEIKGTYVAEDPPWYAHGIFNQSPYGKLEKHVGLWGKSIRRIMDGTDSDGLTMVDVAEKLALIKSMTPSEQKIITDLPFSFADKNADIHNAPHLFGEVPADQAVILLDPVADMMDDLRYLNAAAGQRDGADGNISELLHDGYLEIGDEFTGLAMPNGVLSARLNWRKTS